MEYHEELVDVVTLVVLWRVFIIMECHEVGIRGRNDQHLLVCGQ